MQILWLSQNLPFPPKTGVLQRNYHLIREASHFADIHLVAILKRDVLPDYNAELAERRLRDLCASVTVVDLPVENSRLLFGWILLKSLFTPLPFTINWAHSAKLVDAIRVIRDTYLPDLVYFDTISLAPYRQYLPGVAAALNHHNIESALFERRIAFERNVLKRCYLRQEARKLAAYEASTCADFAVNIAVSELDASRLREVCPEVGTAVVANGVDVDYFAERTSEFEAGHLVMVSGMNWFPNRDAVHYMVRDIWPLIARALPQCRLTIVGASPPPEVQALAAQDTRVTVTGFVEDVRPYIERAQIYICPMRDGGGTRLKILDALAMSRPIVATTMALEGIPVAPERDVLIADRPEDFLHQVRRVFENPAFGCRIARNGREFVVKHFSWPVVGDAMQSAFRSAIGAGVTHD